MFMKVRVAVATVRKDLASDEGRMFLLFVLGLAFYVFTKGS